MKDYGCEEKFYSISHLLGGRAARSIRFVKLKLCITALKNLGHHFLFIRKYIIFSGEV